MRPLKLSLRGLNSFEETQVIDFEKLTSRGLFGIFGVTGSGKSSILDAITIALYGNIAREEGKGILSNSINVNCDTMAVSFEFQISGKEPKQYRVIKEIGRNKATGGALTKVAKLLDITDKNEEILAEKVADVHKNIIKIIGLEYDDFVRTVVLPQGKFNEFLKLEGKDRRIMLERLFNLQKYGEELSRKLDRVRKKENDNKNLLTGEMMTYSDIDLQKLREEKANLELFKIELEKISKENKQTSEQFLKAKELWDMIAEMAIYKNKKNSLLEESDKIEKYKQDLHFSREAQMIIPQILRYENLAEEGNLLHGKIREAKIKYENLEETKKISDQEFEVSEKNILVKHPSLLTEKIKLEQSKENYEKYLKLEQETNNYINELYTREGVLKQQKINIEILKNDLSSYKSNVEQKKVFVKELSTPENIKNKVVESVNQLEKVDYLNAQKLTKEQELFNINEKSNSKNKDLIKLKSESEKKEKALEILKKEQDKLKFNEKTQNEYILEMQEKITASSHKKEVFEKYKSEKNSLEELNRVLQNEIEIHKHSEKVLKKSIEDKEVEFKKLQKNNLVEIIKEELSEGDNCPICGNHIISIDKSNSSNARLYEKKIYSVENEITNLKSQYENLKTELAKKQQSIETNSLKLEELKTFIKTNEYLEEIDIKLMQEKFFKDRKVIEQELERKAELELQIVIEADEIASLNTKSAVNQSIIKENTISIEKLKLEIDEIKKIITEINNSVQKTAFELGVENIREKYEQILNNESVIEENRKKIESLEITVEEISSELQNSSERITQSEKDIQELSTILNEKQKIFDEIKNSLIKSLGEISDPSQALDKVKIDIDEIENSYEENRKKKQEIEINYEEAKKSKEKLETRFEDIKSEIYDLRKTLCAEIEQRSFEKLSDITDPFVEKQTFKTAREKVKASILKKEESDLLDLRIQSYNNEYSKITGILEKLQEQIGNRSINEEEFQQIEKEKNEIQQKQKNLEDECVRLQTSLDKNIQRMENLKLLQKKMDKLEEKLGKLNDLTKLFEGKKFVEFIAVQQLKYVTIEATRRLEEITSGNFSLETDEQGSFKIRDNKNGGVLRDASTLSGGETFVVSLALSLALSAQIQLKNAAPLELFFLDEGFGTLDENLLDTVISSLERIHNEKLKIGLITHVEQIKQRIPVKLLIEPAKSGQGGSKAKVEFG